MSEDYREVRIFHLTEPYHEHEDNSPHYDSWKVTDGTSEGRGKTLKAAVKSFVRCEATERFRVWQEQELQREADLKARQEADAQKRREARAAKAAAKASA